MPTSPSTRKSLLIYLATIPFIAILLAFTFGHSSYKIYLPLWAIHSCIFYAAAWKLGASHIKSPDNEKQHIVVLCLFMILPWIFITVFAGMGPPPTTIPDWLASAMEQQIRYVILIASGLLFTCGFVLLKELLNKKGERLYASLGLAFILVKLPLYILDMLYLGAYRTALFGVYAASPATTKRPDWTIPIRQLFFDIGMVEIPLTYLATAAFALSMKKTQLIKPVSCRIYLGFSLVGFLLSILPDFVPPPLLFASYLTSIPAVTFIMPYFFAIHLLRKL